jgi:hypothetical protein
VCLQSPMQRMCEESVTQRLRVAAQGALAAGIVEEALTSVWMLQQVRQSPACRVVLLDTNISERELRPTAMHCWHKGIIVFVDPVSVPKSTRCDLARQYLCGSGRYPPSMLRHCIHLIAVGQCAVSQYACAPMQDTTPLHASAAATVVVKCQGLSPCSCASCASPASPARLVRHCSVWLGAAT